jgi:hypothetical protein
MGWIGLATCDFPTGDFLLQSPSSRGKIEPTARTRIMDTPADEVTSLLLGWNAEGRAMEQGRVKQAWLELYRLSRRPYRKLESRPCHQ